MRTPVPHPLLATERSEGKILWVCFLFALSAHVVIFLLPLKKEPYIPEPPKPPTFPVLVPFDLKPPKIPERTVVEANTRTRRVPVPSRDPDEVMLEPVHEPVLPDLPAVPDGESFLILEDNVEPPQPEVRNSWDRDLVLPVRLEGGPEPEYPDLGIASRTSGTVLLQAVVDEQGRVVELKVLRSPVPDPGFSEAALQAVRSWRYEPGTVRGRPVAVRMTVMVEFSLR